jgi:hypothetical protein
MPFLSNVIKSNVVVCIILLLLCTDILMFLIWLLSKEKRALKIIALILIFVSFAVIVVVRDYVYPFERTVDVELVTEIELDEPLTEYWVDSWQAFYEGYGLYAASYSIVARFEGRRLDFELPEMNLEKYTYVVTYGKKIEKLTYNAWDTIYAPIRTGAKKGNIQFYEEFDHKVYVYKLKKMRIDNPNI